MFKSCIRKKNVSICHKDNPCSGKYGDSLDVILTNKCNAKCTFCVQRNNKHYIPKTETCTSNLASIIEKHKAKNILLVGGEPTMSHHLGPLLEKITKTKKVYLTTNGSYLAPVPAMYRNLQLLSGLNVSIHSPSEKINNDVFKIKDNSCPDGIVFNNIRDTVKWLRSKNSSMNIRINANLSKAGISTYQDAYDMVLLARYLGMGSVRFAELQGVSVEEGFVFAKDVFDKPDWWPKKGGFDDDPFACGCERKTSIDNFEVTVRRVCGIVSKNLPPVKNPIGRNVMTQVLHPDGVITDGFTGLPDCHKDKSKKQDISDCHHFNATENDCHRGHGDNCH